MLATRPWSFPASTMPVFVTMMYLWSKGIEVNWWLGIMALVNIVLVHAAGNVWSDYHDYKRGVDAPDTYGVRILTDKQFTPKEVYTLSPLKYAALGDLVIMACYALLPMLGTTFICSGNIVPQVLWLAVPVGSITVAILHANNARDIETDKRAHISTFAMLTGRPAAINVYLFEMVLPYCWLLAVALLGYVSLWTLVTFITLPIALGNCKQMLSCKTEGIKAIANLDEATAKLQLAFSMTLAIGLIIEALI